MHLTDDQVIEHLIRGKVPGAAEHLVTCAVCEAEVETYRDVLALTRNLPGPPPGFADEVWAGIRWRLDEPRPRKRRPWATILATAAAVAFAVVAGVMIWRERHVPAEHPMAAPEAETAPKVREKMAVTVTPPTDPKVKKRLAVVDNTTNPHRLAEFARHDPSLRVRLEAISALGFAGDRESSGYLVDIYRHAPEPEARQFVVMALLLHKDTASVEILESEEKDPAVKERISAMLKSYSRSMRQHALEEPPPVEPARNRKPR